MDDTLRKLQMTQLEMLKLVDRICRDNGIRYSLYAGTLLGAVRHKGFIPWDDDLDICMSRDEYDRFLGLWDHTDHDGFILQNKENTPSFTQSFTKIRKDHTTFIQNEWEAGLYHNGIFIDIFPIDRIPDGRISRSLFQWRCMKYQLYTRGFVPKDNGRLLKAGSNVLLSLTPKNRIPVRRNKLLKRITANNPNHSLHTVGIERFNTMGIPLSSNLMDGFVMLPFEDGTFMCTASWDDYLKDKFGDYMQYPPLNEQTWRHHPIVLDFVHNGDELKEGI